MPMTKRRVGDRRKPPENKLTSKGGSLFSSLVAAKLFFIRYVFSYPLFSSFCKVSHATSGLWTSKVQLSYILTVYLQPSDLAYSLEDCQIILILQDAFTKADLGKLNPKLSDSP